MNGDNAYIVEFNGVSLNYHDAQGETQAIRGLDFGVKKGEFVSIVGPSGCGKTSVLSIAAGIAVPSGGKVRIEGGRPGYMLQQDHLLDWRTVEGNILLGLEVQGNLNEESRGYALGLLKTYGLGAFAKRYPSQLSGGMRQKVALIRTLATRPELLLLDEPFSALDFQTRLMLCDEMHDILKREGKTVILVTHDISEAISMGDRVLVFRARPTGVKAEHIIDLSGKSPLERRNAANFKDYFNAIWGELDHDEAK